MKTLFFPGPFDPDFRIPIIVVTSMIVYIKSYIKHIFSYNT